MGGETTKVVTTSRMNCISNLDLYGHPDFPLQRLYEVYPGQHPQPWLTGFWNASNLRVWSILTSHFYSIYRLAGRSLS